MAKTSATIDSFDTQESAVTAVGGVLKGLALSGYSLNQIKIVITAEK